MTDGQHNGYFSECYRCKTLMWMPNSHYLAARRSSQISFYCSFGHGQIFAEGESEENKLRRERDRLAQQIAQRDDEIRRQREARESAERQAAAARGQITKMKRRASAGVCPCCNRTFTALQQHIRAKHPQFQAEAGVVVPLRGKKTA